MEVPNFAIMRLGKNSVNVIETLDTFHDSPSTPYEFTVSCRQVPSNVKAGFYCFVCLGSDNSKGKKTEWNRGLRAFGKLLKKESEPNWQDSLKLTVEIKIVLPESISNADFLARAANEYYWFSGMPMIGIDSFYYQTVQKIKSKAPTQNIKALFSGIQAVHPGFSDQVENNYSELSFLFDYEIPDEKIEGHGKDLLSDDGWADYPLSSVFVRKENRTVNEVVNRINNGRFILNPDFQRDFVWSQKKQSRLIESCLMRIPLPVFYVAEAKDGKIIVVDGLQRLTTFKFFLNNDFALKGIKSSLTLSDEDAYVGKRFNELSVGLQERVEDTQLTLYILDPNAPDRTKLDIFERVNSGAVLTRQQMRNCLFTGPATNWLKKASENKLFLKATGHSIDSKSMRNREVINRFCGFYLLGTEQYNQSDMDGFLGKTLEKMNTMSKQDLNELFQAFEHSMRINHLVFGRHAFRKSLSETSSGAARSVINIALFDVCSVIFSSLEEEFVAENLNSLKSKMRILMSDYDFFQAITTGTNSATKVKTRFKKMREMFSEEF